MLKETEVKLDLLTDIEMFKMIENGGIRGGISQISHRHAIANNKYMSTYDPSKNIIYKDKSTGKLINSSLIDKTKINEGISKGLIEVEDTGDSYIIYLDANNLYGYSMIQHMATGNFKWNYKHDNEELNKEE